MFHFELLFEGFVGAGMLSAAVAGSVFASPPARNVLHAIHCVARGNKGENICNIIFRQMTSLTLLPFLCTNIHLQTVFQ
jgi:hypothetical protein